MTEMKYPVLDMVSRTMQNLYIIENRDVPADDKWEVTQLINSFLGVVAYPWETWETELRDIRLDSLEGKRWPRLAPLDSRDTACESVGDLVRLVRNAFAHGNINFHTDSRSNHICALTIWNTDPETHLRTWAAKVDIRTMKQVLTAMCTQIQEFAVPNQKRMPGHVMDQAGDGREICFACRRKMKPGNHYYSTVAASLPPELEQRWLPSRIQNT
jgi:hypothetical protein